VKELREGDTLRSHVKELCEGVRWRSNVKKLSYVHVLGVYVLCDESKS